MKQPTVVARFCIGLASVALLPALRAQQADRPMPLLLPPDCSLVLHLKGPAALQRIHAQDPFGAMLRSDAMQNVWKAAVAELGPLLQEWSKTLPADTPLRPEQWQALPAAVQAFDGAVQLAVWMDPQLDIQDFDPDHVGAILQVAPGSADFAALLPPTIRFLEQRLEVGRRIEVAGVQAAIAAVPGLPGLELTLPFLYRGSLCVCIAGDVEALLIRAQRGGAPEAGLRRMLDGDGAYAHLDFRNLRQALLRWLAAPAEQGPGAWARIVEQVFGVSAMDRVVVRSYSRGGRSFTDMEWRWQGEPRGVLNAILPQPGRPSRLQPFVPYQLQGTSLSSLEVSKLVRSLVGAVQLLAGTPGATVRMPSLDAMQAAFQERIGIRLFEDLLDHLGPDYMEVEHAVVAGEEAAIDEVSPRLERFQVRFEDTCHVLSLRDGVAFGKSLERMIRKLALHTGRKRTEYKGQRIYTVKNPLLGGLELHYAVHPECALFAVGRGGLLCLHAVLDEVVHHQEGGDRRIPKPVQAVLESLPDGYYATGHANMRELREFLVGSFELAEAAGAEAWEWAVPAAITDPKARRLFGRFAQLIVELAAAPVPAGAGYSVTVVRYQDRTLRWREIW